MSGLLVSKIRAKGREFWRQDTSDTEAALARRARQVLGQLAGHGKSIRLVSSDGQEDGAGSVELPSSAVRLLLDLLSQIAAGHTVSIVPINAELTTQQAADTLGVSRPFMIRLLERGELPFHRVGTHRRVNHGDLVAYQRRQQDARHLALDELTRQAQELGLGY